MPHAACNLDADGHTCSRVWDTATGQCLQTIVHEDNAPVTTVRFSPNGRYILAHTLDSCIRLWDYVSGTCKKTYQGHVNTKFSLGGAFGVGGSEGYIVSGSEDGDIFFWNARTKDVLQTVSGHEGVVSWVDTSSAKPGVVVSGSLDGTVRLWVDVNEDDEHVGTLTGLKLESGESVDDLMGEPVVENGSRFLDTPREMSVDVERLEEPEPERDPTESPDKMDED